MPLRNIFKKYASPLSQFRDTLSNMCSARSIIIYYRVSLLLFHNPGHQLTPSQGYSLRIQFMAQHIPPTRSTLEAHCGLTQTSFGPVLVSGSCVDMTFPTLMKPDDDRFSFQFAELSNLHTHLTLRNLRPLGTKKRAIPYGYGFGLISCPNYFFESVAWAAVAYMSGSWAGTMLPTFDPKVDN
jgi:hypothetical protein